MLGFLARRTVLGVITVVAVSIFSYAIIQMPAGDYVDVYMQRLLEGTFSGGGIDPQTYREMEAGLRKQFGLDQPAYVQYLKWAGKMIRGDFGVSIEYRRPIWEVIQDRLLLTVVLAGSTVLFTWGLAIPIGIYSAVRQ